MKNKKRAFVRDEGTSTNRYFIYVEERYGATSGGSVRFSRRDVADRVCRAINDGFKAEGTLMNYCKIHDQHDHEHCEVCGLPIFDHEEGQHDCPPAFQQRAC